MFSLGLHDNKGDGTTANIFNEYQIKSSKVKITSMQKRKSESLNMTIIYIG
jgi:hypothetical protein